MRKTTKKLYVAYGSNLHLEQMARRCPNAKIYGRGLVKNYELTFWGAHSNRGGVATILPKKGVDVPVGVFEITASDEKNLDVYEGFPHLYRKENIKVMLDNGEVITGMVYIMNYGQTATPSEYYYDVIASGYQSFKFDLNFLKAARHKVIETVDEAEMSQFSFMRMF